jgi:pyruvate,orthophosphate dikinase
MVSDFKSLCETQTGEKFPEDWDQLWASITAVFDSWMNLEQFIIEG